MIVRPSVPHLVLAALLVGAATARGALAPVSALDLFEPLRSAAIGGAGVAIGNDPALAPVNPAAAARVAAPSLTLGGQSGLFRDLLGHGNVAVPSDRGTWFAGFVYYESPSVQLRAPDDSVRTVLLQQDLLVAGGYARAISPGLSWGVTAKVMRSHLFEEFVAQAGAVDLGLQARLTDTLKAGVAVRNLGPSFRYAEDALQPRAEAHAGVASGWRVRQGGQDSPGDTLIIAADFAWNLHAGYGEVRAGAEYRWLGLLAFRVGSSIGGVPGELARLAAGLGFSNGPYRLDYSIRFSTGFTMPQALAITLAF
ncbi:MAG: hypothetical protein AAB152_00070 [Candidatus Coatesbacteria bacterium]